ncbi:MAG: glycosyltransferase family 2 protein, partial [Oscillospiraceae bacterium]|nr:glycosyltransferase family 2 protein [Oscillospiraceae bacterium]
MITVVVSVYNTGQYLSKALDALLGQTYEDFELLIVDDGSTDDSGEICEREAKRSTKIRVFHKPNGGLSSARNFGIEHAAGEYIIFP